MSKYGRFLIIIIIRLLFWQEVWGFATPHQLAIATSTGPGGPGTANPWETESGAEKVIPAPAHGPWALNAICAIHLGGVNGVLEAREPGPRVREAVLCPTLLHLQL